MFRINLFGPVLDNIASVRRQYERIGILIGELLYDQLWIKDLVIGGDENAEEDTLVIPPKKLAKIADDIVKGKLEGRIVGWYLSRPGFGIHMAQQDLDTYTKLLKLSPFAVTLVADPEVGEFGIWALEPDVGIVQVSNEHIRIIECGP